MFKKISNKESYWGVVEDVEDPLKAGRLRVRVVTVFDDIPVDAIPWAESKQDTIHHDLPAKGEIVQIEFPHDVAYMPVWYRKRSKYDGKTSEDDYKSATILVEKDLARYQLDGKIRCAYNDSEGFVIEVVKGDKLSEIVVRPDNTILIRNGKTNQAIHIADDNISIGRETKSQQPAVVGDDNMKALQKLNDEIKTLSEMMDKHLKIIAAVCGSISVLKPLKPLFKAYAAEVKSQIASIHSSNDSFFPETKSKVVTVDKTKP